MNRRIKLLPLALVASALAFVASPAQATQTMTLTLPSGTFGNDGVGAVGSPTAAFTNTFTFGAAGSAFLVNLAGYTLANATLSTSALGGNNIDFTSAVLNGTAFTLSPTGVFEFGSAGPVSLLAINTLTINGINTGDSAYAGTLTFAAVPSVPEPATWGMMLLGFGVMGVSLRRRRRSLPSLAQAI